MSPANANHATAILGTGSYAPENIVTNDDLAARGINTTDEWIRTRTGIRQRHIAADGEATSDLAVRAAQAALEDARLAPADIDLIIVATLTPDMPMPACASMVQTKLGARPGIPCFDLNAACTGFLYALDTAWAMVASGRYKHALIIGAEKLSSVLNWQDRNTCVLFGDGAGAAIIGARDARRKSPGFAVPSSESGVSGHSQTLKPSPELPKPSNTEAQTRNAELLTEKKSASAVPAADAEILGVRIYCEGETDILRIPVGGSLRPHTADTYALRQHYVQMKGREVFKIAVREMTRAAREILEQHALSIDQIACLIPHQANRRIIDAIAKNFKLTPERLYINLDRYGNTSAASIPIALDEARRTGRIRPGDHTLLIAFGAGLTYGSALLRW